VATPEPNGLDVVIVGKDGSRDKRRPDARIVSTTTSFSALLDFTVLHSTTQSYYGKPIKAEAEAKNDKKQHRYKPVLGTEVLTVACITSSGGILPPFDDVLNKIVSDRAQEWITIDDLRGRIRVALANALGRIVAGDTKSRQTRARIAAPRLWKPNS
jgi:hypothetical protein